MHLCSGFGYITVLSHSAHCLCLSNKLSILTDKLCSYLKVQTVSKRQVLRNAVFVNYLLTSRLRYGQLKSAVSLSLTAQNRRRERRHCTELALAAGAVLAKSSKGMKAKI